MMKDQGAGKTAERAVEDLLARHAGDLAARAVADYVRGTRRDEERKALRDLIQHLEEKARERNEAPIAARDIARPRVVACFGPAQRDASAESESLAALARIILTARIQESGAFRVVEREALETMLSELDLGASALSEKGKSLETMVAEAGHDLERRRQAPEPLEEHLTDQILPLLALVVGSLETQEVTPHTLANLEVIQAFLGPVIVRQGKRFRAVPPARL